MTETEWVNHMFQVTKPRILDVCNLVGLERHRERGGMLIYTIASFPEYLCRNGLRKTVNWVIDRHPREVALVILFMTVFQSLPDTLPDTSIWMYASLRELGSWLLGLFTHEKTSTPRRSLTIGVIPDGNRRWGKHEDIGPQNGHFYGSSRIIECIRSAVIDTRIGHLIIYVMSYDNIQKRSRYEQQCLLAILRGWVTELQWLNQCRLVRVRICGEPTGEVMACLEGLPINPEDNPDSPIGGGSRGNLGSPTEDNPDLPIGGGSRGNLGSPLVTLLVGYDGRREIQHAQGNPSRLWIQDDIDGVIRTGGTKRASGFCTYQTGYSEWIFTDEMWPEMTPTKFNEYVSKIEESVGLQNHGK